MKNFKDFLFELAFSRNVAEDKISGYSYELNNHICKTIIDPNNISFKHWIKEIYNFCLIVSRIKLKNSKSTKKTDILNWLFETSINSEKQFKDMVEGIIWEYNIKTKYNDEMWDKYTEIRNEIIELIVNDNVNHNNVINLFKNE